MNVLVLGGTQFLGRHIVERLHAGAREWIELPLWVESEAFRGICRTSNAAARSAGLSAQREEQLLALVQSS